MFTATTSRTRTDILHTVRRIRQCQYPCHNEYTSRSSGGSLSQLNSNHCPLRVPLVDGFVIDKYGTSRTRHLTVCLALSPHDARHPPLAPSRAPCRRTACRAATRDNALVSQPFDTYDSAFPLHAVLEDADDVLGPELRVEGA